MSDLSRFLGAYPRLHYACRAREVRSARPGGGVLSDHQARILAHLDEEDPAMVGELADVMAVTASTMSLNLTRLEKGGFISRQRDPEDRRVMNVRLTTQGREMRDASSLLDVARVDALLSGLRPEERRRALDGLSILADASDRMLARGSAYLESLIG